MLCGEWQVVRRVVQALQAKRCYDICREFDKKGTRRERAPFVLCSGCRKRSYCVWEKARYVASKAQAKHDGAQARAYRYRPASRTTAHDGGQGQEAARPRAEPRDHMRPSTGTSSPVSVPPSVHMDRGIMGLSNIELPRKVRYAPRRKREAGGKMSLEGRTYADWLALPDDLRLLTVEIDCVGACGATRSAYCRSTSCGCSSSSTSCSRPRRRPTSRRPSTPWRAIVRARSRTSSR